jgi:glycosyltransferase 2 family protein
MSHPLKKIAWLFARFALPTAIIAFLLWQIEPDDWEQLRQQRKNWGLITIAALLTLFATTVSFLRWWLLVRALSIKLSVLEAIKLGAIGHFMAYVSAGSLGGDLFKGIFLAHRSPGKRIEALASIGVDRVLGLVGLLTVVATTLLFFSPESQDPLVHTIRGVALTATPVAWCGIAALVYGGKYVDRGLLLLRRIPKVGRGLFRLAEFVRIFDQHRVAIFTAMAMSLIVHLTLVFSVDLIARSLFAQTPTLQEHLVIVPCGLTASALPITPAGLGVFEMAIEHLYRVVPATSTAANGTLVALAYDMIRLLVTAIGMLFYWTAGREVKASLSKAEHYVVPEPS